MPKILVVDDELSITDILRPLFVREGYEVSVANTGMDALELLKRDCFDLMITDLKLPDTDGITLFVSAKEFQKHMPVIVMTAYTGVDTAVEAMKRGAYHYLTKPFKLDEMLLLANRALSYAMTFLENEVLKDSIDAHCHFGSLVGDSQPMLRIYKLIEKVARTNSTVLVRGESGTGKELVARALHSASQRKTYPFIAINCSAMPESLLESELFGHVKGSFTGAVTNKLGLLKAADKGTLFLDEIGGIPLTMQSKLLRTLQEKEIRPVGGTETIPIDVRLVAATNEDLEAKARQGTFREDLYYRLSVIPLNLPTLSERKEDIPLLAAHFLKKFNAENTAKGNFELTEQVLDVLRSYDWPGNVRELENLLYRIATLGSDLTPEELPDFFRDKLHLLRGRDFTGTGERFFASPPAGTGEKFSAPTELEPLDNFVTRMESDYIEQVLARCGNDKELAAKRLDISLATFYRKYKTKERKKE